jgi:predicted transcriptional regulator
MVIIQFEPMDTEFLDQLAHQLKVDKTPACRRAIADVKKRCENGEYPDPMEAGSAFREFVDNERACQKAKAV